MWADPCIDPGPDLERGGICMEDDADDERSAGLLPECHFYFFNINIIKLERHVR